MAEIKPAKMLSLRLSKLPAKQVEASVAQDPLFDKALAVFGDHREVSLVTKPPVVPQELTDKEGGELISIKVPKTER